MISKYLSKYLPIVILLLWSLLETLNWYKSGLIYYGDQNLFLYRGVNNYLYYFYAPYHFYTYPGVANGILFNYFYLFLYLFGKIPLNNNQEILNLVFLLFASSGMYYLSREVQSNILKTIEKEFNNYYQIMISISVAIFYISNWSLELAPTFLPLYQEFIIYTILPWIIYFIIIIFESNKMKFFYVLIASFLTSIVVIVSNYSFLEQTVFIIGIFFVYSVFATKKVERINPKVTIEKFLLFIINLFILILFMVYPLYVIIKSTLNPYFITASSQYFIGNSSVNYFYLSLMGLGTGGSSLRFTYPSITITFGLLIVFIAYFIPIQYIIVRKSNRLALELSILIFIGLVFVAFYSGVNPSSPFSPIVKFLFSSTSIFTEFRTNAFAVSFYYALVFSLLIGIGTMLLLFGIKKKKFKVIIIILIFVLVNILYPFPVITGSHDSNLASIKIPAYVDSAYNFTEHLDGKHNILLLPQSYLWSYTTYYTGVNMLQHVSKDPVITGSPYQERYNNYSDRMYNEFCNLTSTIYNLNVNKSNQLYLQNLFYIMNIKYIYFQGNLNYNDSKYNKSLINLYKNTTLLKSITHFKNITIYETNINSSFIFISKSLDIKNILTNKTLLERDNLAKILVPIYSYSFNKYNDNFDFKIPFNGTVLLTFVYSNDYHLENSSSFSLLWFNEFKNVKWYPSLISLDYNSVSISEERNEYFIGLSIFLLEIVTFGVCVEIRKLRK